LAGPEGEVIAMIFDPHPASVLRPGSEPRRISTFEQRERWLRSAGADRSVRLTPSPELLGIEAEVFIEQLVKDFAPSHIVEGADFHFGQGRRGNVGVLSDLGRRLGFVCHVVPPVEVALTDQHLVPASSTMVRWLVSNGRVRDAAMVLGKPYSIDGVVVRGDRRGRSIGFPTANLRTPCMMPGDGVYAGLATLQNGQQLATAVNVGARPTFGVAVRAIEAHLLNAPFDVDEDGTKRVAGMPEYGWGMTIEFIAWLRDSVAFASLDELLAQIHRDCERAQECVLPTSGNHGKGSTRVQKTGLEAVS
ncbi:MAG: hypothetical protein H7210_12005, partial [Pyrinomonadaceae bacterium]|nr:hypothetical protein [Phycisphaerales bacterium]